jgi:hypothetical protein
MALTDAEIEHRFNHHPPGDPETIRAHEMMRENARHLAYCIRDLLPEGKERDNAIECAELAMFWGNAGIARRTRLPVGQH